MFFDLRNDAGVIYYIIISRFRDCPGLPKIKFGGWPNRDMASPPSLTPSQPGDPADPATMTHAHSSNTGNCMHALAYRHIQACTHAQADTRA